MNHKKPDNHKHSNPNQQETLKNTFIKALDISTSKDDGQNRNILPAAGNQLPSIGLDDNKSSTASTSLYSAMSAYAYRDAMLASNNIAKRQDFEQSYKSLEDPGTVDNTKPTDSKTDSSNANTMAPNSRVDRYDEVVQRAADKYGVDSALIKAVMRAESGGNSHAISRAGARGLMQLMPATARDLGVRNSFNPKENIEGGTKYLRQLLDRYDGNVTQAVAAYNWGMGNLERRPSRMPAETKNYIAKVQSYYKNYSEMSASTSGSGSPETS
ncbi:MAG: lytic transglycosylase domain-containing protein [Nitrospirae bacterium]|nr:lytic transglycosylase domain-containing protein [Nitrospirota bacterium]